MDEFTTTTEHGDSAISKALDLPNDSILSESRSGYCCDSGYYGDDEPREIELSWFYWQIILYRNEPERISIEFYPDEHGEIEWNSGVVFRIETGDMPERSTTTFYVDQTDD